MDLRQALNAVSDVIVNRPAPLREFDQIYMKAADMLLQAEHISRWTDGKSIVFVGDGDAISLCLIHLLNEGHFDKGPSEVLVLDFDERVVNAIKGFAFKYRIQGKIAARLYNVADPLPEDIWGRYDAFYSNPPFGASNGGSSVRAFMTRGIEATCADSVGCLVIADQATLAWTQDILLSVQGYAVESGFVIAEMIPAMHQYHLDDAPELTSCSLILRRVRHSSKEYASLPLSTEKRLSFYGANSPLVVRYVKDLTGGGRFPSRGYKTVPFDEEQPCRVP